jgi:predicted RNA-binding Zn-ribbon protein involved in translation (DUF1610 family)
VKQTGAHADLITFAWRVDPRASHSHFICPECLPAQCRACRTRANDRVVLVGAARVSWCIAMASAGYLP